LCPAGGVLLAELDVVPELLHPAAIRASAARAAYPRTVRSENAPDGDTALPGAGQKATLQADTSY